MARRVHLEVPRPVSLGPAPRSPFPLPSVSSAQLGRSAGAGRRRRSGFSAGTRQNRKLPAGRRGEEGGAGAGGEGPGGEPRAGNARGAGPQSWPVAVSGPWPSVWSPTSTSGRTCFRGCERSGRRRRALGAEAAAQVLAARVRGGGEPVRAGGRGGEPAVHPRGLPGGVGGGRPDRKGVGSPWPLPTWGG